MNDAVGFYERLAVWSQILGSVAFLGVLVYAFQRFLVPTVVVSQERKNAELVEAERRRDAMKEDVALAQRELSGVDEEVRALRVRAVVDSRKERERVLALATAEGKRLVSAAEGELERGRAAAREAFRDALLEKALRIARRAAAENFDAETDRALISGVTEAVGRRSDGAQAAHV